MRSRLRYAATGAALGLVLALVSAVSNDRDLPSCYEDEVIVWTGDTHGACVALDDMWVDPVRGSVHWYQGDERR